MLLSCCQIEKTQWLGLVFRFGCETGGHFGVSLTKSANGITALISQMRNRMEIYEEPCSCFLVARGGP
jgi:hypothetical protein